MSQSELSPELNWWFKTNQRQFKYNSECNGKMHLCQVYETMKRHYTVPNEKGAQSMGPAFIGKYDKYPPILSTNVY